MQNLLTQTLSAYINNPLPLRFKEKLLAYLSRYCSVPYCIVCHSCALRSLGMTAGEVLALLHTPAPTVQEAAEHVRTLAAIDAPLQPWPESGSPLEKSLLLLTFFLFSQPKSAEECRNELRRLLGADCFNHLIDLLFFVKTYHFWAETHPRLDYRSDRRVQENLGLYICKTIIERHRGQVGVVTSPGAGATFWFSLPLTKKAMNEASH
jgi:two-component system, cell cycle sensor histidine kinase and response regulator CckA